MTAPREGAADWLVDATATRDIVGSRRVFRSGRVIDVRSDDVTMSDGVITRDVVVHPGAVAIIAVDNRGQVMLLQQYRHPVGRMLWEPPAGLLDIAGEPALDAARRELYEEAHLEADDWRVLVDIFTSPGMTDEAIRIFLARGVRESERERHPAEAEEVGMVLRWVSLDDAVAAVIGGRVHNPLAVAGLLAAATTRGSWDELRLPNAPWPEASPWIGSRGSAG